MLNTVASCCRHGSKLHGVTFVPLIASFIHPHWLELDDFGRRFIPDGYTNVSSGNDLVASSIMFYRMGLDHFTVLVVFIMRLCDFYT